MLTRLAVLLMVLTGTLVTASTAHASGNCPPGLAPASVAGVGVICIEATDPGTPGSSSPDPYQPVDNPTGGGCQRDSGSPVDCVTDWGVWMPAHQCWAHTVFVPPGDPAWEGHTDGSVWMCALLDDSVPPVLFWMPPGADPAPLPDPGELAQRALDRLVLEQAEVHVAPAYPDAAVVGIENWLWVPRSQWQTLEETVRAGGTSVTVAARPERVVWDMGPEERTCFEPGREWVDGMGDSAVTTCGYTYEQTSQSQPDGLFRVTATIQYAVDWTCSGTCTAPSGSLGVVDGPTGDGTVRVEQRQTVVVR